MPLYLIIILGGVFCIWCAVKDYDWFMENHRARPIVRLLGRNGARVFYIVLGAFVILCGVMLTILHAIGYTD